MLLQIAVTLGSFAIAYGGSSLTSVSKPYGGSYTYGIDHDNYGAWYGSPSPHIDGPTAGGLYGVYGHEGLNDGSYGYATYGAGYGHGDYGTSYQNYNLETVGGHKVLHSGYGVHHGHGATSYANLYQKTGHSSLYDSHHGSYAGGYGHEHYGPAISTANFNLNSHHELDHAHIGHYGPAISSQNFNLYSAGHGYGGGYGHYHHGPAYSLANFNLKSYSHHQPILSYGIHDLSSLGHADHSSLYGHGYDGLTTLSVGDLGGYGHLDYSHLTPYYGNLDDHGLYDYAGYAQHDFSSY